ncbi:MAG: energy transducer TonB [Acidobacteria bacterium]|nr:energy transducer TonB [Acidobacteriota bacterium]
MFDKMIVSNESGADSKGRGRYFLVTSGIVALLFGSAVVLSIYAVNLDLGIDDFELSMMLAPVTPVEPELPRPEPERNQAPAQRSETPTRVLNMLRPEEQPISIPDKTSVTPNQFMSRPLGDFKTNNVDSLGEGKPSDTGTGRVGNSEPSSSSSYTEPVADTIKIPDPPPVIKPKPSGPISLGVVNGQASSLPKPPYPAAAIAVNAQGEVKVQVMIDESGRVVSASAISGHPLLRREAERAAMNARFSPTTLSKVPVKVTGMIIYNFKRS